MAHTTFHNPPLLVYLDGLMDELRARLSAALRKNDVDAVHDARVASRRLKAAIDLYEAHLSRGLNKRFKRGLNQIRRALGPLRDFDVMAGHLRRIRSACPARDFALKHLQAERAEAARNVRQLRTSRLLGRLGNWWGLREQICEKPAAPLLRALLRKQLNHFCQQADRYAGVPAENEPTPLHPSLNFHALRIAGKELRYTIEMAREDGFSIPQNSMKTFKQLQDRLGLWHDHVVLTDWLLQLCVREETGYLDAALQRGLIQLAARTARSAAAHLDKFTALWRREGPAARSQIFTALGAEESEAQPLQPEIGEREHRVRANVAG